MFYSNTVDLIKSKIPLRNVKSSGVNSITTLYTSNPHKKRKSQLLFFSTILLFLLALYIYLVEEQSDAQNDSKQKLPKRTKMEVARKFSLNF